MTTPKIFISSTVFDFLDLRSALKDYLEERGCTVFASEYSDFPKGHDKHSYDECLGTIDHSDIFLLLVGKRAGGWYDEEKKISITHAEFNHAVKRVKEGKLKIITFVRDDVWNHRRSIKELKRDLRKRSSIDSKTQSEILAHSTEVMDYPEAIIAFLDAIVRNKETADASRGVGTAPLANWIHPFSTFAEIRQAIDPLILRGLPVRIAAGRKALETQVLAALRNLLTMGDTDILFKEHVILQLVSDLSIKSETYFRNLNIGIKKTQFDQISFISLICCRASCDSAMLSSHLGSDLLFEYNPVSGVYERSEEYDLLVELVSQMRSFEKTSPGKLSEIIKVRRLEKGAYVSVSAQLIADELNRALRWQSAVVAARSLALSLAGGPLILPNTMPRTVFIDQNEDVKSDEVSLDAVRSFVNALRKKN